jgi:hypothetical protein
MPRNDFRELVHHHNNRHAPMKTLAGPKIQDLSRILSIARQLNSQLSSELLSPMISLRSKAQIALISKMSANPT